MRYDKIGCIDPSMGCQGFDHLDKQLLHEVNRVDARVITMNRAFYSLCLLLLVILPARITAQEKYIASYAGFAGFQAPLWAAKDFGLLAKYGVNLDLVMIPGSARGAQAMLGGSIHFGQIDGTALISAINQGADLVFVASSLNRFPFSLVAQKNIRQPKDLVGKKVGIVAFGGAHEVSLILALKEWNIPRQSVTLLASGPASNRLLALSSGALDADATGAAGNRRSRAHGLADARAHD